MTCTDMLYLGSYLHTACNPRLPKDIENCRAIEANLGLLSNYRGQSRNRRRAERGALIHGDEFNSSLTGKVEATLARWGLTLTFPSGRRTSPPLGSTGTRWGPSRREG